MKWSMLGALCLAAASPAIADAQIGRVPRPVVPPPVVPPVTVQPINPTIWNRWVTPAAPPAPLPVLNGPTPVQPPVNVRPPPEPPPEPPPSDSSCEYRDGHINCVGNAAEANEIAPAELETSNAVGPVADPPAEPSRPAGLPRVLVILAGAALLIWLFGRLGRR